MIFGAAGAVEAILARADFLAHRGAQIMRGAAVFTWAGAVAATLAAFSVLGGVGWTIGIAALFPGWLLWRYGTKLAGALDVDQIGGQLGGAAGLAKTRFSEVVADVRALRRQPLRGGFRVFKTVRGLRADLDNFGVDVAGIAEISNPGSIFVAMLSLAIGTGLWMIALIGVAARIVL